MSYKRLTKWSETGTLHVFDFCNKEVSLYEVTALDIDQIAGRLADLEDKIESGELDYVADRKTEQTITDLLIEFDEMGFAPTTVCPDVEEYATDWRERVRKEFARLTIKNAELQETLSKMETVEKELRARIENAVELPCKQGDTIFYIQYFCNYKGCDSTTQQFCCGCKEMIERERRKEKYVISEKSFELKDFEKIGKKYFTTREAAEARLAELKRSRQ